MGDRDLRPLVAVAHVTLETPCMAQSAAFFRAIGMRSVFEGPEISILELRGGTHLILMRRDEVAGASAPFDLMVDDVRAEHRRFLEMGLAPSPIEARPAIDHEVFTLREPGGREITFFSSHASGEPV